MANEIELLRRLEPAVRPGNLPAPHREAAQPFESRSFESILDEARAMSDDDIEQDNVAKPTGGLLSGLDRIENASLHELMARRGENN
jgi:hypothetical protein